MYHRQTARSVRLLALCALLALGTGRAAWALDVAGPLTINSGNAAIYANQDIVVTGGTVVIDTPLTIKSLVVKFGAVITHSAGSTAGLQLSVTNDASINLSGAINVDGRGYPGSTGPGAGWNSPGSYGGGHASYGGEGTNSSAVYGSPKLPTDLGSGGGSGYAGAYAGASGGGAIQLSVGGTLTVDGTISANGATGANAGNWSGSGSGGSILLNVGTLSGIGSIGANGGQYAGGGRIAINYSVANNIPRLSSRILAVGGALNYFGTVTAAGAGTVVVKGPTNAQGELWVNNNIPNNTSNSATVFPTPITFDKVYVWNLGQISPPYGGTLNLTVTGDMLVGVNSSVNGYARGYGGGQGPGAGDYNSGSGGGGGASYGGEGTPGSGANYPAAGTVYGDPKNPVDLGSGEHLGSGGGSGGNGTVQGGSGGGAIRITVGGTLQVDGTITANGAGTGTGGGGSGGSIILNVSTLTGVGAVSASGGSANYGTSGAGGGGRIAINYTSAITMPRNNIYALGGDSSYFSSHVYGGAGTVVVKGPTQTQGELRVYNGYRSGYWTVLPDPITFDKVTIWGQGVLGSNYGDILTLTVLGDLVVEVDGYLSANSRGYMPGQGPGAGANNNGGGGGAGGSYGGKGGTGYPGNNPAGGPTYGDKFIPLDFGSGGGTGFSGSYSGGPGGGALYLVVNGTLRVDGTINSLGGSGTPQGGGGGAGGSIYAKAGTLTGTGFIQAVGGNGGNYFSTYYGGGGGGGRIALYTGVNSFADSNISVAGGYGGSVAATPGTIYKETFTGVALAGLSVDKSQVAGGQIATATITLTGAAPAGGVTVTLTNSDPTVADVPATVTVLEGATSATFPVTGKSSSTNRTTTLGAYLGGATASVSVTVVPWLSGLSVNPASIQSGNTATGKITLNVAASAGGLTISLASNDTAVTVPASVTVPAGATSATFTVTVGAVTTAHTATITASYGVEAQNASAFVTPATTALIKSVAMTPASVIGGVGNSIGVVTLTAKAPAGGLIVALSNSKPDVTNVPASVMIAAGKTSASFVVSTKSVAASTAVTINATLGASTKPGTLTVKPKGGLSSVILVPATVKGGETSIGIVTLDSISTSPVTITITSNKAQAIPDTTLVIPAGSLSGAFSIDTSVVSVKVTATITVKVGTTSKTATLTITP